MLLLRAEEDLELQHKIFLGGKRGCNTFLTLKSTVPGGHQTILPRRIEFWLWLVVRLHNILFYCVFATPSLWSQRQGVSCTSLDLKQTTERKQWGIFRKCSTCCTSSIVHAQYWQCSIFVGLLPTKGSRGSFPFIRFYTCVIYMYIYLT